MITSHSFHIPVMGIGYTIDTPLKVSRYGIDSVISLVDDILIEKLRKMYCSKFEIPYNEITEKTEDFRAKRITSYLNLIHELASKKFEDFKNSAIETSNELREYMSILPDSSSLKKEFTNLISNHATLKDIKSWIHTHVSMGSIDVNIMTKVDKDNYYEKEKLPIAYNDAHAALRGYANSNLTSSLILSAGMNPRLYNYLENFEEFYPTKNGTFKKRIVLKVSDYRSALIQGKYLAKKGLWVSEYRIESGLNCGGHAFATDGHLLGPILAKFRDSRKELRQSVQEILTRALSQKGKIVPTIELPLKITAQGGVGTAEEHQFLLDHYQVDSVGWGTPFLLVPEATTVDNHTLKKLIKAKEEDLYLSNISPLGVPFNNLRNNTKDIEKFNLISKGRPGSSCPKKYVALNHEFPEKVLCTASRQYQYLKLQQLEKENLSPEKYQNEYNKIVEKSCVCVGLGTAALLANNLDTSVEGDGVSICPGPNIAYFSKEVSLSETIDHIYGRTNIITRTDRPNMFIKELTIYLEFLSKKIDEIKEDITDKQTKYLITFSDNLKKGIAYYYELFSTQKNLQDKTKLSIINDLETNKKLLDLLCEKISVYATKRTHHTV
ncbi:hypothetical protein [Aquimarina sp. RZ0]|uniref:hypothetical protein n=1 Tax=Aquimarina sp. RZ0 TaxID=2607730 RepID=UPI0011F0F16B|nr:hypothetical protein [Aquimarina sp. RZ0]KAA1242728.1 hypothetical protein F0000_24360 [Aquimarina sp. RZ0]